MKGFANPSQPFTKLTVCILMSYGIFVKGEGLTDEFIAIVMSPFQGLAAHVIHRGAD